MTFKKNIFTLIFFHSLLSFSQVKIGQWVDHLSYNSTNAVTKVDNIVYVSNGQGLVKYSISDNSVEKFTKIHGLSDVGIISIKKNDYNNSVLIIYSNSNIDIIQSNGNIVNISDLKRKIIAGKKNINEIYFNKQYAYLSCGFGIIIVDTEKFEIKDTYQIGNGSAFKEVYQVTNNDTAVFAATETGIYFGLQSKNLSNYQNWHSLNTGITAGPYNSIVNFNGKIIANYSARMASNVSMADTLFQFYAGVWSKFPFKTNSENKKIYDYSKYGKLLILDQWGLVDYSTTGVVGNYITNYGFDLANINDGYYEGGSNFWLADNKHGLIKSLGAYSNEKITINGPSNNFSNDLAIKDGNLVVAPVNLGPTFSYMYNRQKPNVYQNKEWTSLSSIPDSTYDLNCVAIDPKDKNHIAFGSMGKGVVELRNNQLSAIYNTSNSSMIGATPGNELFLTGLNFDSNSNLWALNTGNLRSVSVKKNNSWLNLNFDNIISKPTLSKIIFDKNDKAWIILARGTGLMVYKDVNTLSQPNVSNTKLLTTAKGNGFLPSLDIYSICEDLDGKIWVGTAKGITVFYNPENVFTSSNFDSQQILIEQDNHVQILLENDIISAIAVDGVNRKWIGTESSGVYCFSSDGQTQIYHFAVDNSPIYSNVIRDIVVDETTGDVFIATENGIQAFRTTIIKGYEDFTNVHAFPNPIKPGYSGKVYVTGLIDEATVKITDIAGNLVWETKSEGGQIEWNLQTFSGTKVASGVYIIYCASSTGDKSATTKLLVVN